MIKYFKDILKNRDFLDPDEALLLKANVVAHWSDDPVAVQAQGGPAPKQGDLRLNTVDGTMEIYDGVNWWKTPQRQYLPPAMPAGLPPSLTGGWPVEVIGNVKVTEKETEGCPKCGHLGDFVRMALCCPAHGIFGGC